MGNRQRIAGYILLASVAVLLALGQGDARAQSKIMAKPVQFTPSTQEPPLAGSKPIPPPPPFPPPQPPVITTPPPLSAPPPIKGGVCLEDPPTPVVSLRVRVNACANANQEIEYRLTVKNESSSAAHHVLVRNPLPANARFVRATPEPTTQEPDLRWNFGTLEACACKEIVLILLPTNSDDIKNCARVQFEHGQCVTTRLVRSAPVVGDPPPMPPVNDKPPQVIPLPPDNKKTTEPPLVTEDGTPAKLILAIDGPKAQYAGPTTRYRVTVSNTGKAAATNVLVTSLLPEGTTYVRSSTGGTMLKSQVAWLLGTLAAGESRTVELFLKADKAGDLCVSGRALADKGVDAKAEFCTKFQGVPALSLEMVDRDDPIEVGGKTSYTIQVVNQGTAVVTNLRIKALVPPQLGVTQTRGASDGPAKLPVPTADGVTVQFEPLLTLAPGARAEYEVFVNALAAGDVRFRVEMSADQLQAGGPVREEESTRILPTLAGGPPQVKEVNRAMVERM